MKRLLLLFILFVPPILYAQTGNEGIYVNPKFSMTPLDGNHLLGDLYDSSKCGLNFVQASVKVTNRNTSGGTGTGLPATFTISGLPTCKKIDVAYLWFEQSFWPGSPAAPWVTVTNPSASTYSYTATQIGADQGKCWSESGTWAFRVDVTNAVTGNGNYSVNIETNPGSPYPNGDDIDGATLFIIYADPNAAYQGSLKIKDGIITNVNNNASVTTITGINACGNSTSATGFAISGDFQVLAVASSHSTTINGTGALYSSDFWNFDKASTTVTAGQANSSFSTVPLGTDCHSLIAVGLYYQTTVCATCPMPLTASITATPASCNQNNGSATVNLSSAQYAPYSYVWTPAGGTNATATGLAPGNYTVTISDASGCKAVTATTTISSSGGMGSVTVTPTAVSCNGSGNGMATAVPSGGSSPYTYLWSNGQSGATATGLIAGNYSVTVTDASGCSSLTPVTITQPAAVTVSTSITQASCGVANGSATATGGGGTPSYTYQWNNGQQGATATGLLAGLYTVTVTDAKGCTKIKVVSVSNSNGPNSTLSQTNILCKGLCTGSASVGVAGGTSPYTYTWSTGQSTSAENNLCAGTYTLIVTDASGCTDAQSVNITEPAALSVSVSTAPAACGNNNGSAAANVSGGAGTYTYSWSDGQITSTATGLAPGNYSVTVTDANGCTDVQTAAVNNLAGLSSVMSQTNVLCSGQCNGNATATMSGGTTPYTYLWSNSQKAATATGLCAGSYTVVVTDASGCSEVQTVNITQPGPISVTTSSTPASCSASDGTATANANGGTGSLTYLWSPGGQATAGVSGLSAGNYIVTVADANGCSQQTGVTVGSTSNISSAISATNALCNGTATGSATVFVSGGSAPYTYAWNTSSPTGSATATGLSAGTYSCLVTDASGCTSVGVTTITQPAAISLTTQAQNENCGKGDGSATVSANGGTGSYTYVWSNGQSSQNANSLAAGTYSVSVSDSNGCTQAATAIVATNPGPMAGVGADITIEMGQSANLSSGGGVSYSWSPATGLSCTNCQNPVASPTETTQYCVKVTDANGCTDSACVKVTLEPPCPDNIALDLPNAFTPNADGHNDIFLIAGLNHCIEKFTLVIYNRWGEKVFESDEMDRSWDGIYHGKKLDPAVFVYYFSAKFKNGQSVIKKGNISLLQ